MQELLGKDRLRLLLDHFGEVGDPREAAKVKYPLLEVLFLVTCATMAGCDDYARSPHGANTISGSCEDTRNIILEHHVKIGFGCSSTGSSRLYLKHAFCPGRLRWAMAALI